MRRDAEDRKLREQMKKYRDPRTPTILATI
jgi:hypothetical protein